MARVLSNGRGDQDRFSRILSVPARGDKYRFRGHQTRSGMSASALGARGTFGVGVDRLSPA